MAAAGVHTGAVAALLKDLGPQLRRGESLGEASFGEAPLRDAMGLPDVDALLGGGVPRGRIVEIAGPSSSGRTSLALGWLARVTQAGEVAAVVDMADALDPPSASAAGVVLPRILWVRAPGLREALRATERLLRTRGFALVLLDLDAPAATDRARPGDRNDRIHSGSWLRLSRAAASAGTSLALLAGERMAGTFSDLALELRPAGARFSPAPALLEAIESRA
ncbi:MAG: hypothetical protein HKP30_04715, partial [Myxococcales bacterium]|nr:hypothetical protein [Myxococcales bacterium]